MNTKSQLVLDKFIAKPLAYLLNFLVRLLGKILSIDHNLNKDFKTIAICKFKGMGSIIQATPMMDALKKKYPNAKIIFVSTISNKALLEKIDVVDESILLNDSGFLKFIFSNFSSLIKLIKIRPEVYIDLEIYSDFSTLFTLFSLSKNRIGFYLRSSSFRMGIYTHMMLFNSRLPIAKVYLQIANLLNADTLDSKLFNFKNINESNILPQNEYIIINPNASDLRLERRWDSKNFIELINTIIKDFPHLEIVLIGSKGEQEYTEKIFSHFTNSKVINTAGKTSLAQLITLIKNAKLVISNDTGPMHLSFAVNTPVVCLFGPCSPEQYGISTNAIVIYKKVYCSPCVHDFEVAPCNGNNVCMQLISTNEVYDKVKPILEGNFLQKSNSQSNVIYKDNSNYALGIVNR